YNQIRDFANLYATDQLVDSENLRRVDCHRLQRFFLCQSECGGSSRLKWQVPHVSGIVGLESESDTRLLALAGLRIVSVITVVLAIRDFGHRADDYRNTLLLQQRRDLLSLIGAVD